MTSTPNYLADQDKRKVSTKSREFIKNKLNKLVFVVEGETQLKSAMEGQCEFGTNTLAQ